MADITWPAFRYHKKHGGRIFGNQTELDSAGEGWRETPFTYCDEVTGEVKPILDEADNFPARSVGRPRRDK